MRTSTKIYIDQNLCLSSKVQLLSQSYNSLAVNMKQLKNTTLLATVFAASLHLLLTDASSFTIVDERVRSLKTSPALGRGYSVGTNSYHSNCLILTRHMCACDALQWGNSNGIMPDETTSPSYNYSQHSTHSTIVHWLSVNISCTFLLDKFHSHILCPYFAAPYNIC